MSLFMTRDGAFSLWLRVCFLCFVVSSAYEVWDAGTVITLTRREMKEVLSPIYERLEDEQSLLRQSGDSSMLAQALLDVCECYIYLKEP